jgi:hypothetical protein
MTIEATVASVIGVVWDEVARSRRDRGRLLDGPRRCGDDGSESGG